MNKNLFYSFQADIIRVLAILGVVIIHIINGVYTRADFFGTTTWWISIVLDSLSRTSIPLFIMLSGFLLLGKDESFLSSLKRILIRIAIPFTFWLLFYVWLGPGIPYIHRINITIFSNLFYADVYHLYFLVIIMGLYFVAPLLRSFLNTATQASSDLLVKLLLLVGVVEVGFQFLFQSCISENFFTRWVPYAGFFIAGYLLSKKTESFKTNKLLFIFTVGLAFTIGLNYLYYFLKLSDTTIMAGRGCLSHYSDHYLSINVVLMSIAAFLILMKTKFDSLKNNKVCLGIIKSVATTSFGIFLIHPFVARMIEIYLHLAIDFSPLPIIVIVTTKLVLVFVISYLLTVLIMKVPLLKLIVGGK